MWCPRCRAHGGDCPCLTESCMGDGWDGVDTAFGYVAYPSSSRLQGREWVGPSGEAGQPRRHVGERDSAMGNASSARSAARISGPLTRDEGVPGVGHDTGDALHWRHAACVQGEDGTVRLIPREAAEGGPESSLWPVAHGIPDRVVRLRGVGNAIVPQCATGIYAIIAEREKRIMLEDVCRR
jgi:hypothetical protein